MYYGNQPGQAQTRSSPMLNPIYNLQQAPGPGAGGASLLNAYMMYPQGNAPQSTGNPLDSHPGSAWSQASHIQTTLYGNGSGFPNTGGQNGNGGNGGNNSSNGSGGQNTVTSTINPRPIYSPESIARNTNQRVAQALAGGDARLHQQRFAGRGRSLDSGTRSAVMPQVAAAENAAAEASINSPLQDWNENQQNILQGQVGRAGESLGMGNMLDNFYGNQQSQQQSLLMSLFGLMGGI